MSFITSKGDFDFLFMVKFPKIYIIPFDEIKGNSLTLEIYEDYAYDLTNPETYNNPPKL